MTAQLTGTDPKSLCLQINERAPAGGLFEGDRDKLHPDSRLPWRISPEPFWLTQAQYSFLEELGGVLHQFYKACNLLYQHSVKGLQPGWIHQYLDRGKPERVIEMSRLNRLRSQLPMVMRPDLLLTEGGVRITELDAVPGGMGFTGHVSSLYGELGYDIIGGPEGLIEGFYQAIASAARQAEPIAVITVSDESETYREEMSWLAAQLRQKGYPIYCRHPRDLHFDEEGLLIEEEGQKLRVDAIYRFFELFDLPNIPKAEMVTYFAKKNAVRVTPPTKAYLEEKMWLAFLHHPALQGFWRQNLDSTAYTTLLEAVPQTWIVDATPAPPHTTIPDLFLGGNPVNDWNQLKNLSKKEREFVLKPSGFSDQAYESRGVAIGHDMPEEDWAAAVDTALAHFDTTPYILQQFHKAARLPVKYYDFHKDEIRPMRGRVLLRPYYYLIDDAPRLAGVQALVCPADKKILHGMVDAVLIPCAVAQEDGAAF